jgi:chorismate lyase
VCGRLELVRLRQRLARPLPGEPALLGIRPGEHAWVREVLLLADGQPVLYAHSVARRMALRTGWKPLSQVGLRSMGDAIFELRGLQRSPIHVRRLNSGDHLHRAARKALGKRPAAQAAALAGLWARRSSFTRAGQALWITEVFLPAIGKLGAPSSGAIIDPAYPPRPWSGAARP